MNSKPGALPRVLYAAIASALIAGLVTPSLAAPPAPAGSGDLGTDEDGGFLAKVSLSNFPNNGGPVGAPLLGGMGGLRPWLSKYGVSLFLSETSEDLGNLTGGLKEGFEYDGVTQLIVQLDTQQAGGWYGGTFNVSGLEVHGSNVSLEHLGVLQTASGIEAEPSVRLWEAWYQQKFFTGDKLEVRIGQESLDQEFMVSENGNVFVNSMMGWPMLPSANLPGGSSAYPLSALGVRVQARLADALELRVGVFNGSPVAGNADDPQKENRYGTSFPLNGGALVIAELEYTYPSFGTLIDADKPQPLAREFKLGFWYDSESFADEALDTEGLSLANPASSGIPRMHHGDYSFYGIMDQMLWQSDEAASRTLSVFSKAMGAPEGNRNLINFSAVAGFTLHEPIDHRDDDTLGIGAGYTTVSSGAAGLDRAVGLYTHSYYPVRGSETFWEVTYQYQAAPWWQIQPDFQYYLNPGGGILNPGASGQKVGNEAVIGLRTNIQF